MNNIGAIQIKPMALRDIDVIDVDTHLTEPHDLWTSRAPAAYVDRVPQVKDVDGKPMWVVDGDIKLGRALASAVIRPDGSKVLGAGGLFNMELADAHPG